MISGKRLPFLVVWGKKIGPRKRGTKYELLIRSVNENSNTLYNFPILLNCRFEKEMDEFLEELNLKSMGECLNEIDF